MGAERTKRLSPFFIDPASSIDGVLVGPSSKRHPLGRPHLEVGVNAQNSQAVAFYEALGFTAYASSPTDDDGRPYLILRMRR